MNEARRPTSRGRPEVALLDQAEVQQEGEPVGDDRPAEPAQDLELLARCAVARPHEAEHEGERVALATAAPAPGMSAFNAVRFVHEFGRYTGCVGLPAPLVTRFGLSAGSDLTFAEIQH